MKKSSLSILFLLIGSLISKNACAFTPEDLEKDVAFFLILGHHGDDCQLQLTQVAYFLNLWDGKSHGCWTDERSQRRHWFTLAGYYAGRALKKCEQDKIFKAISQMFPTKQQQAQQQQEESKQGGE